MAKVIITAKGSKMPTNSWAEGQEIECHDNIAKLFIERGIAIDPKNKEQVEKPDEQVEQVEKPEGKKKKNKNEKI